MIGSFISLYMAICLNFGAFSKQLESLTHQLNLEAEKGKSADSIIIKERIVKIIKHHTFIKEYKNRFSFIHCEKKTLMHMCLFQYISGSFGLFSTIFAFVSFQRSIRVDHLELCSSSSKNNLKNN